jgi:hypothetical protein
MMPAFKVKSSMAMSSNTVVMRLTHEPKLECSNPTTARKKKVEKVKV